MSRWAAPSNPSSMKLTWLRSRSLVILLLMYSATRKAFTILNDVSFGHHCPWSIFLWCGTIATPVTSRYWSYGTWSNLSLVSAYSQEWQTALQHGSRAAGSWIQRGAAEHFDIFLALLRQQLGLMVEETLKTRSYQCHPALHPCVPEDQSRHHGWWRVQLPGYQSLGSSKSCFGMTSCHQLRNCFRISIVLLTRRYWDSSVDCPCRGLVVRRKGSNGLWRWGTIATTWSPWHPWRNSQGHRRLIA